MTDVRRERIPLLWITVGDTAMAKGFCSNMGDTKYLCVCRRTKGYTQRKGQRNRQEMSQRRCDR